MRITTNPPILEEDLFAKQWTTATKSILQRMEPHDRRTIRSFRTYQDVREDFIVTQDEEPPEAPLQELAMLEPRLGDMNNFSDFFAVQLCATLDPSMFWGLLGLLLSLVMQHGEPMRNVSKMLKKFGRDCHDFLLHCQQSPNITREDKESCFDIFLTMTTFFADFVQLVRRCDDDLSETDSAHGRQHPVWSGINEKFNTAVRDIEDTLVRMDRVAAIYQRQYRGDMASWLSYLSLSPRASHDTAQLPCFVLPTRQTTRFFNRDEVIEKIEQHLGNRESTSSLRALALYGMGGVGKSHVAMKYLENRQAAKDIDAIFWVNAETPISIQQSATDIALRLKLPDTGPATHDENRMILKGWLQQTECRWLIIYDNVEAAELLRDYWPLSGSKGQVLITTRNHSLSFDPADTGIEILPWDTDTGSKFLLHLLAGQISAEFLANETQSACSLAERLSGHALALSNMCGLIHRRSWSISELVEIYDRSRDFKDGLEVVWQLSFEGLRPECVALLSSLSFCAPDSIPQSLFEFGEDTEGLTADMAWYLDADRLSSTTEELLTLALIKRDRYARVFSIHRLIVSQFHRFLKPEDRQKAFFEASILMYNVFPKKPKQAGATRANLYNVWDKCQLLLQHVLQLKTSFVKARKWNASFSACRETCELWVQCQRFLLETQNWRELEDLVTVNKFAMSTLPNPSKEIYLLSSTEIHVATMWAFRARFKLALESLQTAHRLKLTESPIELQNLCWMEDNMASIYGCLGDYKMGLEWIKRSRETWRRWSESTGSALACPPLLKLTHGRILAHGGWLDEARVQLTEAIDGLLSAKPLVWAPTASCKFALGRLLMFEKRYDAAEKMLLECQSMWLQGDKSRALDFNGIVVYQLGCCALLRGDVDSAVNHLREAVVISSVHKDTHPGKYARCLFKVSEALRGSPGTEAEADQKLSEARELYFHIVGGTATTAVMLTDDDFNSLVHLSQR